MVKVIAQGKTFYCEHGAKLRKVLLENSVDLHNGGAEVINCRGIGTCGTCAVKVAGEVSKANWRDKTRRVLLSPFSYKKPAFSVSNLCFG